MKNPGSKSGKIMSINLRKITLLLCAVLLICVCINMFMPSVGVLTSSSTSSEQYWKSFFSRNVTGGAGSGRNISSGSSSSSGSFGFLFGSSTSGDKGNKPGGVQEVPRDASKESHHQPKGAKATAAADISSFPDADVSAAEAVALYGAYWKENARSVLTEFTALLHKRQQRPKPSSSSSSALTTPKTGPSQSALRNFTLREVSLETLTFSNSFLSTTNRMPRVSLIHTCAKDSYSSTELGIKPSLAGIADLAEHRKKFFHYVQSSNFSAGSKQILTEAGTRDFRKYTSWLFPESPPFEPSLHFNTSHPEETCKPHPEWKSDYLKERVFRLRNFCIRPHGNLLVGPKSGLVVKMGSLDDVYWTGVGPFFNEVKAWLNGAKRDLTGNECYLQTKLVLYPIFQRCDNMCHVTMRIGSLKRIIQQMFPPKTHITIGFVILPEGNKLCTNAHKNRNISNSFTFYANMIGHDHFASWGMDIYPHELKVFFPDGFDKTGAMQRAMCFSEAILWHNAHKFTPKETSDARDAPGFQFQFNLFGPRVPRDKETMKIVTDLMAGCFGLKRRPAPNRDRPVIIFALRTAARFFTQNGLIIAMMHEYLSRNSAALDVSEHTKLPPAELVRRHINADGLVGMLGASMIWSMLLPPRSICAEINYHGKNIYAIKDGINLNVITTEYGGNGYSSNINHISYTVPNSQIRIPFGLWHLSKQNNDDQNLDVPPEVFLEIARMGLCFARGPHPTAIDKPPPAPRPVPPPPPPKPIGHRPIVELNKGNKTASIRKPSTPMFGALVPGTKKVGVPVTNADNAGVGAKAAAGATAGPSEFPDDENEPLAGVRTGGSMNEKQEAHKSAARRRVAGVLSRRLQQLQPSQQPTAAQQQATTAAAKATPPATAAAAAKTSTPATAAAAAAKTSTPATAAAKPKTSTPATAAAAPKISKVTAAQKIPNVTAAASPVLNPNVTATRAPATARPSPTPRPPPPTPPGASCFMDHQYIRDAMSWYLKDTDGRFIRELARWFTSEPGIFQEGRALVNPDAAKLFAEMFVHYRNVGFTTNILEVSPVPRSLQLCPHVDPSKPLTDELISAFATQELDEDASVVSRTNVGYWSVAAHYFQKVRPRVMNMVPKVYAQDRKRPPCHKPQQQQGQGQKSQAENASSSTSRKLLEAKGKLVPVVRRVANKVASVPPAASGVPAPPPPPGGARTQHHHERPATPQPATPRPAAGRNLLTAAVNAPPPPPPAPTKKPKATTSEGKQREARRIATEQRREQFSSNLLIPWRRTQTYMSTHGCEMDIDKIIADGGDNSNINLHGCCEAFHLIFVEWQTLNWPVEQEAEKQKTAKEGPKGVDAEAVESRSGSDRHQNATTTAQKPKSPQEKRAALVRFFGALLNKGSHLLVTNVPQSVCDSGEFAQLTAYTSHNATVCKHGLGVIVRLQGQKSCQHTAGAGGGGGGARAQQSQGSQNQRPAAAARPASAKRQTAAAQGSQRNKTTEQNDQNLSDSLPAQEGIKVRTVAIPEKLKEPSVVGKKRKLEGNMGNNFGEVEEENMLVSGKT